MASILQPHCLLQPHFHLNRTSTSEPTNGNGSVCTILGLESWATAPGRGFTELECWLEELLMCIIFPDELPLLVCSGGQSA